MLGKRIRMRRIELGLGVRDFADRVGVCPKSVQNWENGQDPISVNRVADLCRVFNCDVRAIGNDPAEWIRNNRYKLGMAQSDLANAVGVSHRVVSRWETGMDGLKSFVVVRRLCEALRWEIWELVEPQKSREKTEPFATFEDVKAYLLGAFD